MGIGLEVPRDWEIARHSIHMRKGALNFVDRHLQRLQVSWTQCRSEPLIEQMFDDHRDRQLEDHSNARFNRFKHRSGFEVLQRQFDSGQVVNRAARYDRKTRRLIEAVVLCQDDSRDERAIRDDLLDSIRVKTPADRARHWRAFGCDVLTPEDYQPVQCDVMAADVTLAFRHFQPRARSTDPTDAKARHEKATLRKIGMADAWNHSSLKRILLADHRKLNFDFGQTVLNDDQTGEGRIDATTARTIELGPRLKRIFGRLRTRRDLLWHSSRANAVFHISTLSFDKAPLEPRDFKLRPTMDGILEAPEQASQDPSAWPTAASR